MIGGGIEEHILSNLKNKIGVALCLALLTHAAQSLARDGEPRLDRAAPVAVGLGFEISRGDYGVKADATLVTLPLSVFLHPADKLDMTFEAPLLYLSRRSDSGVFVTGAGGAGRGRGAVRASAAGSGSTTESRNGLGDINMTAGWILLDEGEWTPKVRPTVYVKVPSGDPDRGLGTGTVETGPGLALSKWLGKVQLFAEGACIFQNSTSDYPGRNYVSYLGGAGIQATDRLFVSLLAKGSSSRAEGVDAPVESRLKLNFMHSRRISWELFGSAGLTDASPDYGCGMGLIYQF